MLALLLGSLGQLCGQVSVDIVMDQEQFLRDESLPLKVRVNNLSGQTLKLGQADWLTFLVQSQDGYSITRLAQVPVQEEFSLESAKAALRRVDLMPYYDLSRPGRYSVTAIVKIKQWDQELVSQPKTFDIVSGFKLWEQEFGVPGAKDAPEVRKYVLQQANYLKRLVLYLRVTDANETQVYRVFPIGPLVSFGRPEAKLDQSSNLHVLSQSGGRSFIYMVVNPNGAVLVRQRYDYTETRPVLRMAEDGKVVVKGGMRNITPEDLPPPPSPDSVTNDVETPTP